MREVPSGLGTLLRPFMLPLQESGERHLFGATRERFPSKAEGESMEGDVAVGNDGIKGSGSTVLIGTEDFFTE